MRAWVVEATHAPTPDKINAAATANRLILRIRVLPFIELNRHMRPLKQCVESGGA
jgi:hypothetical protein